MQNTHVPSHETLMVRFQTRLDSEAFEQIVSFYINPALAIARQILSDDSLSEDAVQESFLRVIRKRQQYIPSSPFSCWFYAIVRNVCIDILRKQTLEKDVIENAIAISEPGNKQAEISEIPALLDNLIGHERDVLMLRIVNGLRFRDIATALGISEEAAKKRAQRALKRLRTMVLASEKTRDALLAMI